jgi:predicted TIM-barrel fold metal-dependent hydrolase
MTISDSVLEIPEIMGIGWSKNRTAQSAGAPYPAGTIVVSCDDHLLEPPTMWVDRVPAALRDKAPTLWMDDLGWHIRLGDRDMPNLPGLNFCAFECLPGASDQDARIADMDAEGVDMQVLSPQKSLGLIRLPDLELRLACIRAYNQYLSEFCARRPSRFAGHAILPVWNPETTRDDLQEISALGFKSFLIPIKPGEDVYYNSRRMEGFWTAIEESGLVCVFHIGENNAVAGGRGGAATNALATMGGFRNLWGLLTFSGVFDRHPGLRVVFTEGGISWAPSAIYDADLIYETYGSDMTPTLSHSPSYYWFNNCYATFMNDPAGLEVLHRIGAERAMWSSDYPHNEGTLGFTRSSVNEVFRYTGEEAAKKVVGSNAIELFGLRPAVPAAVTPELPRT